MANLKKNRKTSVILLLILMLLLTACSEEEAEDKVTQLGGYVWQLREEYVDNSTAAATTEEIQTQESQPEPVENIEQPEIYYAYHTLDKDRQRLYLEILRTLQNMESDKTVSTLDVDELSTVFQYVLSDHPELFYVEGFQYTKYSTAGVLSELTFSGTYTMDRDECRQLQQQIDAVVSSMLEPLSGITDQYTIIRYLYDSLINATEYDSSAANNQNIQSVFLQGRSVCQGYAKAMQYLLQKQGIQTALVTGYANGEGHAWNMVLADGEYYYLDATWGDASYSTGESDTGNVRVPSINYDYFLVTTEELLKTHTPDERLVLPQCTATADNYYVHEGYYLDGYDEDGLTLLFEAGQNSGLGLVTLKCSDEAVYEQLKTRLIDEQEIFHFLHGGAGAVSYTTNETQLTLSFWL